MLTLLQELWKLSKSRHQTRISKLNAIFTFKTVRPLIENNKWVKKKNWRTTKKANSIAISLSSLFSWQIFPSLGMGSCGVSVVSKPAKSDSRVFQCTLKWKLITKYYLIIKVKIFVLFAWLPKSTSLKWFQWLKKNRKAVLLVNWSII